MVAKAGATDPGDDDLVAGQPCANGLSTDDAADRGGRVATVEHVESGDVAQIGQKPVRLTGRDAFWLHFTLVAGLIVCCGAFAFELWRALGGHTFSWMYVFEWPLFGGFAVYMWWNLLQGKDRVHQAAKPSTHAADPPDPELEAWNRYVRRVEADEHPGLGRPV
jgi:hypothetical protein